MLQGQGNQEQTPVTNTGGTTTTTTTVVVTHGNGETETIFDGENLPPGANEVIMNAAAAAFPLDCFPLPSALQVPTVALFYIPNVIKGKTNSCN